MAVVPAFAANNKITTGTWTATSTTAADTIKTITVTDVEDSATALEVVAYQVAKGTYKDGKLTGYVLCDSTNASIADLEQPSVSEITTIANNIRSNTTTLTGIKMTKSDTSFTANVEAGLYVVLATGADSTVYNPAVVAVNVTDANNVASTAAGDTVSMNEYWKFPTHAYLKSSTTNFNKDIVGAETRTIVNPENTEGDIVAIGDTVYFKLDSMTIPTYTDEYAKPNGEGEAGVIFKIEDKLESPSFAGISNLTVKTVVDETGTTVAATETGDWDGDPGTPDTEKTNYTIVYKDSAGETVTGANIAKSAVSYTLQFTDAFLRANAEKGVEITYDTVLTENAHVNYQPNRTTAVLSYTINPSDNTGVEVLRDSTYHYTFELGGVVDGSGDSTTKITTNDGTTEEDAEKVETYEINKVTESLGSEEKYKKTVGEGGKIEVVSEHALAGAEFTLYDDAAFTTIHQIWSRNATSGEWESADAKCTTGADGHINFKGLDTGTYYLKETAAPEGYTLNDNEYKVVISGTISDGTTIEEGTLTSYTVNIYLKNADGTYSDTPLASSTFTAPTITVTKPSTDATASQFDEVVNEVTIVTTPAEVVNTKLAALPSTGGVGTIALTIVAAVGMGGFLTLYIVNKKKKNSAE